MITRRQFGLWTTSALVLGAAAAHAQEAPPKKETLATEGKTSGSPLEVSASLKGITDGVAVVELRARNPAKEGISLAPSLGAVTLELPDVGAEHEHGRPISWLNDHDPFSRRLVQPSYVDVGPGKSITLALVNVQLPEGFQVAPGAQLRIALQLVDYQSPAVHDVTLPPVPLSEDGPRS